MKVKCRVIMKDLKGDFGMGDGVVAEVYYVLPDKQDEKHLAYIKTEAELAIYDKLFKIEWEDRDGGNTESPHK
jgi:hypothetical protein